MTSTNNSNLIENLNRYEKLDILMEKASIEFKDNFLIEIVRWMGEESFSEFLKHFIPNKNRNKMKKYPFNEGDTYYTIEDNMVVESCWDGVSEEIHDENPNRILFKTKEEAQKQIK